MRAPKQVFRPVDLTGIARFGNAELTEPVSLARPDVRPRGV
ncbi:hypothetical protein TRICHSKD4_4661 [Roseibium sp. TrichSKD4]|nr:hypothetical protein TRICHSKD4_4661 [Roseibium sp. TrichSKD4]